MVIAATATKAVSSNGPQATNAAMVISADLQLWLLLLLLPPRSSGTTGPCFPYCTGGLCRSCIVVTQTNGGCCPCCRCCCCFYATLNSLRSSCYPSCYCCCCAASSCSRVVSAPPGLRFWFAKSPAMTDTSLAASPICCTRSQVPGSTPGSTRLANFRASAATANACKEQQKAPKSCAAWRFL